MSGSEYSASTPIYAEHVKACTPATNCQLAMRQFRALLFEANAYAMEGNLDACREKDLQAIAFKASNCR